MTQLVRNSPKWFASIMLLMARMQHYSARWLLRGNSRCHYDNVTDRANSLPSSFSEPQDRLLLCAWCFGAHTDEQMRDSGLRSSGSEVGQRQGLVPHRMSSLGL